MKIVYLCSGAVAAAAGLSFVAKKEAESIGNRESQQLQPVQCSSPKTPKQNCELKTWIVKKCELEMEKSGAPGLLIGVSVDGQTIFSSGSDFLYTTHGWTLVSAVLEKAVGKDFKKIMTQLFNTLGLKNTRFDENEPIIMNRARYYVRNKHGKLINAPYVDNSYKWAGGGFVSTAQDLVKFGNALLYSYQRADSHSSFKLPLPGFLESSTVKMLWTPVDKTQKDPDKDTSYGMGWVVVPAKQQIAFGDEKKFHVYHTGGAVGASSVLLILPSEKTTEFPRGVVVALITNMQSVGLNNLALEIAQEVEKWYVDGK